MKVITTSHTYMPFLCRMLDYAASAQAVCVVSAIADTGKPLAGVIFDSYNGATIHAHIWIDAELKPHREWYSAIFDYPFRQLEVVKIIGQVSSNNLEARKLDENFGFVLEAEIKDYYDDGASLMVYTMTKDQCRVLNSPRWSRVRKSIGGE